MYLKIVYGVRLASRSVPESWLSEGNDRWQALTGVNIGQVLSFESAKFGADGLREFGRQHGAAALRHVTALTGGVKDPVHVFVYSTRGTVGGPGCISSG